MLQRFFLLCALVLHMLHASDYVEIPSKFDLATTVTTLSKTIQTHKEFTLFAVVDHQLNARKVGLDMPQAALIIFGNAIAGTTLMLDDPLMAYELPLKLLVAQKRGGVIISYKEPLRFVDHYRIEHTAVLRKLSTLMKQLVVPCL